MRGASDGSGMDQRPRAAACIQSDNLLSPPSPRTEAGETIRTEAAARKAAAAGRISAAAEAAGGFKIIV